MNKTHGRWSVYKKPVALKEKKAYGDKPEKKAKKKRPTYSFKRKLLNAFMVLSIGLGSTVATAAPAQANMITDGLNRMCSNLTWAMGSATVSNGSVFDAFVDMNHKGGKMTILEKFGFAGPTYTSWVGPFDQNEVPAVIAEKGYKDTNEIFSTSSNCFKPLNHSSVIVGNIILGTAKAVTFVNATLFQFTIGDDTLDNKVSQMVEEMITGLPAGSLYNQGGSGANLDTGGPSLGGEGTRTTIYAYLVYISIMIAALRLLWIGLVKKETLNAGQYVAKTIAVGVIALLALNFPGTVMKWADNVTDLGGTFMAGMISNVSNADGTVNNYCTVDASDGTATQQINRKVQCLFYYNGVFVPWDNGQFGIDTIKNIINIGATTDLGGVPVSPNTLGIFQADNQVKLDTDDESVRQDKEENRLKVAIEMVGNPSAQVEGAGAVNEMWTGADFGGRTGAAFVGLAISLAIGFVIIPSCIAYVVAILSFKISLILMPLIFSIGLFAPELVKKFGIMELTFLVRAVAHMLFIGVALNLMISMMSGPEAPILKVIYLAITAGVLKSLKEPFLDLFSMGLQNQATQAMDKLSGTGSSAASKTAAIGAGAATGFASSIIHQSRNRNSKSGNDKKSSVSSEKVARPKAAENMTVHSSATADDSTSGKNKTATASASQRHNNGPFATSEDGTTTRPGATETAVAPSGPNTRRAEPGFAATEATHKEADRAEVKETAKDESTNRVTPAGFTAAAIAGGAKGAVAGARSSSVSEGLTSGAAAGTASSRVSIERAERKSDIEKKKEAEKERQEELRRQITGGLPKSSSVNSQANKGGLPKRNPGALPGSTGGGLPRTAR